MTQTFSQRILDLFFPPRCPFCSRLLQDREELCPACRKELSQLHSPAPQQGSYGICVSALPYKGIVRSAILQYKFSGKSGRAKPFAALMAPVIARELGGQFDTVSFVPVHPLRRLSRGYDQSYLLCRELCRLWNCKPAVLLKKRRNTKPNSSLSHASARRGNVLGAFIVPHPDLVYGRHILLIDDILTTGSTLAECVRLLRDAGAAHVVCATLAAAEGSDKP